jgi:hypothetical protein
MMAGSRLCRHRIVIYWFPLASNSAAFGQCRYSAINAGKSYWKRNAILELKGARTGLITTKGFRDATCSS